MFAGRRLPHRLIPLVLLAGCTSPRYVGSIGRDGTYSNRGYGLAVRLSSNGLGERWSAIDPMALDRVPKSARPQQHTGPLDVDGDGVLQITERQERFSPALRLLSRTTNDARIDVDVSILGGKNKDAALDALLALELKERVKGSTVAVDQALVGMKKRKVTPNFSARIAEVTTPKGFHRVAVIDHGDFLAEEGIRRRQIVKVVLSAASRTDPLAQDHDRVLDALILNRRASSASVQEKW